jgi:hypothetical protein
LMPEVQDLVVLQPPATHLHRSQAP